jgi:serine protease AprX
MTPTDPQPHDRWRRPKRFASLAAVAALGLTASLTPASSTAAPTSTEQNGQADATLSLSTVELLGGQTSNQVMSLTELRLDVLERNFTDGGHDGSGVDIALIDSGVAPVDGLDGPHVLHGPDLSFEGTSPDAAFLDTYGHGTHMAGILAGRRSGHLGLADGSRIVSLKVAGHDGITTVPQVVAAIDWVIDHRNSDGLNIRVLNLSLGSDNVTDHRGDLLSAAVERAWDAGIVVVVAAGNRGTTPGHIDSPAIDPYVIAVGAGDNTNGADEENQPPSSFTSHGDGVRNPDLMAPGVSIASYRVPGSTIDTLVPSARYDTDLFKGSGSSQAAAVTAASAARLIGAYPSMTPDEVKDTLVRSTEHELGYGAHIVGTGMIDTEDAWQEPRYGADQNHPTAAGPGTGIVTPSGSTWSGGTWSGSTWSGSTWSGTTWSGGTWSGGTWSGGTWSGGTWSGSTWSGGTWSGGTWSGGTWSGGTWSGGTWSGNGWS